MSGLACWKLLSVQSFPASRHFTVVKITAQEICVTLSKSHGLQCRELSFFFPQFSTHLLSFLQTLQAHLLIGISQAHYQDKQDLNPKRVRDCVTPEPEINSLGMFANLSPSSLSDMHKNSAPDREITEFRSSRVGTPPGIAGKLPGLTRKSPS